MLISIVIPVYRSELSIGPLVDRLMEEPSIKKQIEVVLVNDGSPDGSGRVCREITAKYPGRTRLIELSRNFGEHNAVMAGLRHAKGDAAVIMDDDFQNPPSEVSLLIEEMEKGGHDVVYGIYERKRHHWLRNLGSKVNGFMATYLLDKPAGLYLSSFKSLNRFTIDQVIKYDLPYPYLDGLIFRVTKKVGKVMVRHEDRLMGESNYSFRKLVRLWLNMFTNFSVLPLRVATLSGGLTIIFGMVMACVAVYWKYTDPLAPAGWATLVVLAAFFSGVQLISLGVMGEYIGRMFISHSGAPQSIVREVVESEKKEP
ncbi:MAG: glycosyltransferase family 2 protein [Nitrospinae bacterium]|nr:glycosyltransferase family 2 protein [Nitrospinota bacterium]